MGTEQSKHTAAAASTTTQRRGPSTPPRTAMGGAAGMAPIDEDESMKNVLRSSATSAAEHPLSKSAQQQRQQPQRHPPSSASGGARPSLDTVFTLRGSSVPSNTANQLLHAICSRSWDVALTRLAKRPGDALRPVKIEVYGIERRLLPLHLAVAVGAPLEVIRALLEADEDGDAAREGTTNKVREESPKHEGKGKKRRQSKQAKGGKSSDSPKASVKSSGNHDVKSSAVPCAASQLGLGLAHSRPVTPPRATTTVTTQGAGSTKSLSSVLSASSAATTPCSNVTPPQLAFDPLEVAASDGWTPLHLACLYQSPPEIVDLLLLDPDLGFAGAAKVKSGYGLLPLHVAAAGLTSDRLRWSEDAAEEGGGDHPLPHSPQARDKEWGSRWQPGDLVRVVSALLRAFPGAVHVPCSRPLGGNGWARADGQSTTTEPTCGVGADVQLTPVQYARRYLPDTEDTREVLDVLEGRKRAVDCEIADAVQARFGSIVEGSTEFSGSFSSMGTRSMDSSLSQRKKRRSKKKKAKNNRERVQSLRTTVGGATASGGKRKSSHSRSLLQTVAAAMHLHLPSHGSKKSTDEHSTGSGRDEAKPTKLYRLILRHDWTAAKERLVGHPEEASVWTLVDDSGMAGGGDGREPAPPSATTNPRLKKGSYRSGGDEEGEAQYACHRLPLHRACASKPPADLVRALVEAYPDGIRSREKFAMLPLHVACQRGASTEVIETLISMHPASPRERDAFGLLPLHLACTEGCSLDVLSALLRSYPGAVEERDGTGRRPADYVRESLYPNRVAVLRELDRDVNYWFAPSVQDDRPDAAGRGKVPDLYYAVVKKRWEEALELASSDPAQSRVWVIDANSDTGGPSRPRLPLHAACRRRAPVEVVRALLTAHSAGAAAGGGKLDLLPLHMACQHGGDAAAVEELVRAYPEGTAKADGFGLLPIHLAVTEGASPAIVRILLRQYPGGARAKDRRGNTPLAYAEASFHPNKEEVMELLGRDPESWSSAEAATTTTTTTTTSSPPPPPEALPPKNVVESATLTRLIERRDWSRVSERAADHAGEAAAPQNIGDGEGVLLPLHRACAVGAPRHAIEALLKAHPAGAKTSSEEGDLPLHLACKHRASIDTVQVLLEAYPLGASTRDEHGRLPIHIASISGTTLPILEVLLRASPGTAEMTDGKGLTPLQYVEQSFHKNKVELIDILQQQRDESSTRGAHTTRLYDLVAARRWVEVVSRAREAPSEASVWSIDGSNNGVSGRLPVHLACSLNPPRRAVASLINAHVGGVRAVAGKDGSTCLHAACAGGASVDVVQLLINSYPEAVSTRDRAGLLPIHAACSNGASIRVIKLLLRASPESVSVRDGRGWTAMEYAERSHPDHESILASLPYAPAQTGLREGPMPMRSVPARLGIEDEKKHFVNPSHSLTLEEGEALATVSLARATTDSSTEHVDRRGTFAVQMSQANPTQSARSLNNEDEGQRSNVTAMVQIPVISV